MLFSLDYVAGLPVAAWPGYLVFFGVSNLKIWVEYYLNFFLHRLPFTTLEF